MKQLEFKKEEGTKKAQKAQKTRKAKKKKVLLMGKLFEVDLCNAQNFEKSVNEELNQLIAQPNIKDPLTATWNGETLTMELGLTVDDLNDPNVYLNPDSNAIPLEVIIVLEGNQKHSLFPFHTPFGNIYRYRLGIEEFITEYKRSSRANKASRFKTIDVKYSLVKGLTMTLGY